MGDMKRTISFQDLQIKTIKILCIAIKPGKHRDYQDTFRLDPYGFKFHRRYLSVEIHEEEEYEAKIHTKDWVKTFYAIAAEFQTLKFQESDKTIGKIRYEIELFDWDNSTIRRLYLNDHPRLSANKSLLAVLKRVAAVIPEGWPKPYCLDNLGN